MTLTAPLTEIVYPASELAIRAWARSLDLVDASERVFFGTPKNDALDEPWVVMQRVGGAPEPDMAVDLPSIQFSIWGVIGAGTAAVADIAQRLSAAIANVCGAPAGDAVLKGAHVTLGSRFHPDPTDNRPGYVLEGSFTITPSVA